jgi:YesN/AraC family two-component response regulator
MELLRYAEQSFRSDCLLRDAAARIGYDYAYVSKFFKRRVGLSFRQYVNLLRINEARRLLKETSDGISEIKDACGFRCLRTFDREFFTVTGKTPSEYRRRHGTK